LRNHVTVFLDALMREACITLPQEVAIWSVFIPQKYLGVMIDSDLSWREHIYYVYNKILRFCGIFIS